MNQDIQQRIEDVHRAARRVEARVVASAHLLDTPFTDAPHLSPWALFKRDLAALRRAIDQLEAS